MGREARKGAERGHQGGDESNEKCGQAERDAEHGDHVPEVQLPHPRVADHPREAVAHHEEEVVQHREEEPVVLLEALLTRLAPASLEGVHDLLLLVVESPLHFQVVVEDPPRHAGQHGAGEAEVERHDADVGDVEVEVQGHERVEGDEDQGPDEDTELKEEIGLALDAHPQVEQEVEVGLQELALHVRVHVVVLADPLPPGVPEDRVIQGDKRPARAVCGEGHHLRHDGPGPRAPRRLGVRALRGQLLQQDLRDADHREGEEEVQDHREEEDGTQVDRHSPVLHDIVREMNPTAFRIEQHVRVLPEPRLRHDPDGEEGHGAVEEHLREVAEPHLLNGPLGGHGHQVQPLVAAHDEALDVA
mmetsp:Transcript_34515/g.102534  ORF Transcript_34515/g.102534 Transcript_34515/m.102534 type:complete len:360 (+) Transcript_34515:105-1184(+)